MAKDSVTGITRKQLQHERTKYKTGAPNFEEERCLARIPRQPDDYDGPERFCWHPDVKEFGDNYLCKYHGGEGSIDVFDKLANMKHGLHATREHLIEDFDDKDRALYDWITESYSENYDIDVESDPAAAYDLHRLAAEIVRAERGRGYMLREGEVQEDPVRNEEGQVVVDRSGEVVTEKSEHYLAQMMYRQDNKITKLEKALGITRKEQARQETSDDAVEALTKGFAELGSAFLGRDNADYDPDDTPWDEEDADDAD